MADVLVVACVAFAARWQLLWHGGAPSALVALATVALAAAVLAVLAQSAWLGDLTAAAPVIRRAVALQRKSWGAAFQRQLNPDAPGRSRPRAPSAAPAAA